MVQTFIGKLSDAQINAFFAKNYPKSGGYSYRFKKESDKYIYAHVEQNGMLNYSFNCRLEQFDTVHFERHVQWIRYLYEVFGEEYKQAYLENCAKIFN